MNYTFEQLDKVDFKHKDYDGLNQVISNFEIKIYALIKRFKDNREVDDIGLIITKDLYKNSIMKYRFEFQDNIRIRIASWIHDDKIIFATDDIKEIKKYMLLQ